VFRYAAATDRAEVDPSAALVGALVSVQSKGYLAIVEPNGVGGLIRAIRDYPGVLPTKWACTFAPILPCDPVRSQDCVGRTWIGKPGKSTFRRSA